MEHLTHLNEGDNMTFITLMLTLLNSLMILFIMRRLDVFGDILCFLVKFKDRNEDYKITNDEINKAWKEAVGKYRESEGKI